MDKIAASNKFHRMTEISEKKLDFLLPLGQTNCSLCFVVIFRFCCCVAVYCALHKFVSTITDL